MKSKLIVVIVVSAIMLTGGVLELIYINSVFDELEERIERILAEELDEQEIISTGEWLEQKHKGLEYFIPHFELNEVSVIYNEIIGAVAAKDDEGATVLLYRLMKYAERLQDVYTLRFQNIV